MPSFIYRSLKLTPGLPRWLSSKKNPPAKQEMLVQFLGWGDPLERKKKKMATNSSILAVKSHGQRSLVGYSPWSRKSGTQLSN